MKYKIFPADPYPLGVRKVGQDIYASMVSSDKECGLLLYSGKKVLKLPFPEDQHVGQVFSMRIEGVPAEFKGYRMYQGDAVAADQYAACYKSYPYGRLTESSELMGVLQENSFDWGNDKAGKRTERSFSDSVFYGLHVRGFTMHESSRCSHKGTFAGVKEKLDYLQKLGVTSIILMPAYEFIELEPARIKNIKEEKLNYWGYKKGYYYAPKASYAASSNPCREFKQLVKSCHSKGMELFMQFYFSEVPPAEAVRILEYWVLEYHVDGFQLVSEDAAIASAVWRSPILAGTKLIFRDFAVENRGTAGSVQAALEQKRLCICRDDIMEDYRRFLKGDSFMAEAVQEHFSRNSSRRAYLNRIADYYGFRLADLVSYNEKHNQDNGEGNQDGADYNASWNCGIEGPTEDPRIQALRLQQMKNALSLILLSQGTPYLFMGDEMGSTQQGNNNPYNQDNEISWLDWSGLTENKELHEFISKLITYRKANPFLHTEGLLDGRDYLGQGYPNIAFHGQEAYRIRNGENVKKLGIALCGELADRSCKLIYIACNMHWLSGKMALPRLPAGKEWKLVLTTSKEDLAITAKDSYVELPARTVAVLEVQLIGSGAREENAITAF